MSWIQRSQWFIDLSNSHDSMARWIPPPIGFQGHLLNFWANRDRVFQVWPSLAWNALSSFGPHWCDCIIPYWAKPYFYKPPYTMVTGKWTGGRGAPLAKIACYESIEINGSSIGGLSINLWRVAGHLQKPFKDTWWTCAQSVKKIMEPQFWILSTPTSVFGKGKYGNANQNPNVYGFPSLVLIGMKCIVPYWAKP